MCAVGGGAGGGGTKLLVADLWFSG